MMAQKEKRTHCPVCARELEDRWNFCVNCGTQLKAEISEAELNRFRNSDSVSRSQDKNNSCQAD